MGAAESQTEEDPRFFGYRLYKIYPNGPMSQTGAKELEDFIIPPQEVYNNSVSFIDYVKSLEDKECEFNMYSVKKRCFYKMKITPTLKWGEGKLGLLGASVRRESWQTAHKNLVRVLSVKSESVAEKAGLQPMNDWIVALRPEGSDILSLNISLNDPLTNFTEIVHNHRNMKVELIVYNSATGLKFLSYELKTSEPFGCDVGYGRLHEFIKEVTVNNSTSPQETKDEVRDSVKSNDLKEKAQEHVNKEIREAAKEVLTDPSSVDQPKSAEPKSEESEVVLSATPSETTQQHTEITPTATENDSKPAEHDDIVISEVK